MAKPQPTSILSGNLEKSEDLTAEMIEDENGNIEVVFPDQESDEIQEEQVETDFYENLVFYLNDEEQEELAAMVLEGLEEDESSRSKHLQTLADSIDNLGIDDTNADTPFEGACTVYHPLLIENAVKLQAKISGELLPAGGPVKTQILGNPNEELEDKANRIREYLNYQTTTQMEEYYPNSEKAYFQAALLGDCFKKKFIDLTLQRPRDVLISIDRLVVNHQCESIEMADRISEIIYLSPFQMRSYQVSGLYRDDLTVHVDLEPSEIEKTDLQHKIDSIIGVNTENTEGFTVVEQHVFLDLPGFEDELPLPYIVQVDKESETVLAIRRNWHQNKNKYKKREWYSHYGFVPSFGFHNLGLVHLLGNFQKTLTAVLRSLVDAGQFANLQGGFKSKTMRILGGNEPLAPGEFRDVENYGGDITKAFAPLPFKEPSQTLFALLQFIEAGGQKFADSTEQVIADSTNYGPVGTTMALLDASTKFFSSVHKRFHAAQKKEFHILSELNYDILPPDPEQITFNLPNQELRVQREDFNDRIDILPVSDPNISSNAHRMTLASTKIQAAQQAPQIHNMREIYKEFYKAMGVHDVNKLVPPAEEAVNQGPVEDIISAANGKPIKAFQGQDHDAHIAVKSSFLQDQTLGGNPVMQSAAPAIQANIREHIVLKFQEQIGGAVEAGAPGLAEAANTIQEFNEFKARNPGATLAPEQLLAQAEVLNQQNKAKALELQEIDMKVDAAIDAAKIQKDLRGQDIDALKHNLKLKNDKELAKLKEAVKLISEALKDSGKETPQGTVNTSQGE